MNKYLVVVLIFNEASAFKHMNSADFVQDMNKLAAATQIVCGNWISGDCSSEYGNGERNGNLGRFYDRCRTEGGSSPLRLRCSLCCTGPNAPAPPPVVCNSNQYKSGNVCHDLTLCSVGQKQTTAPTAASDRACTTVPCPANSQGTAPSCTCKAGYTGTITAAAGGYTGSCAVVPCPANAEGHAPSCTCKAGYTGTITAAAGGYTGACTVVPCPANAEGTAPSCTCKAGYTGTITAAAGGYSPTSTCQVGVSCTYFKVNLLVNSQPGCLIYKNSFGGQFVVLQENDPIFRRTACESKYAIFRWAEDPSTGKPIGLKAAWPTRNGQTEVNYPGSTMSFDVEATTSNADSSYPLKLPFSIILDNSVIDTAEGQLPKNVARGSIAAASAAATPVSIVERNWGSNCR